MRKIAISVSVLAISLFAESVVEINPISVTATGVEENVLQQPLSIATKGENEIKLDQVIFQKDLLNSLSGVRIEQTGSVIGHMTSIRMPINTGPYYLFMQDGIPVQSSGFFNHNGLAYTTFQNATSVEVLKGAGTALYGSDAVAAVVNVKSAKRPSKTKELIIKGMGGSYGYGSGSVEMSDTIDKKSAYRANVSYMHSDGWREHTKTDRAEANIRFDHEINTDNDVKVIFNASKTVAKQADSFSDYKYIEDGSELASDDPNYYTALEKADVRRKFDYARLSAEFTNYSFNDLEMTFTPYLRYNRNRYVATWTKNLPSNDNKLYTFGFLQKNRYDASWGRIIGGFDAEYTRSSLLYNQDFDITTSGWGGATYLQGPLYDYDVDYLAIAPYAHIEYDITKELMLTAGLRYDYNHYSYDNNLADNSYDDSGTIFRPADRSDSFNHLSPKLSLSFKPQEDLVVYARYANGFRIPQATRLYSMKAGYEDVTLDPETSNTYEMGLKKEFNKKTSIELSAYYMTIDDTITRYKNSTNNEYYYDNGGSTIHQGIEMELRAQMSREWATKLAYSYSKHNYDNDPTYGDNEMQQAPRQLANVRIFYMPTYLQGLTLMGEWQYTSKWWMDDEHSVSEYDGYNIGNVKVDYIFDKKLSLFAKVTNLTDKRYAVMANYAYGNYSYTPGDPRSFYAGLSYKW
jgi:outer membrane receptor protein involved in Fe transport